MRALCIRKSVNTNSFGLRRVWVITREPDEQLGEYLVWSFAVNYLDDSKFRIGEFVDVPMAFGRPAYELNHLQATLPAFRVKKFLNLLNKNFHEIWKAGC